MVDVPWYQDGKLRFSLGVEDTFVPQTRPGERALDEYELMQHYDFWREDLGYCKEVGATQIRWGIPWYRVNPEPGKWDWSWLDQVIDWYNENEVELIADLIHYGTPMWLKDEFASPDYPKYVAEYGHAVAERYRGRIPLYTPVNEPLLNTWFCGEFGHWPPYLEGNDGFVKILQAITRGLVQTQNAIAAADPAAEFVHVEASVRYAGDVDAHAELVAFLQEKRFIVQDLVMGRVDAAHPMVDFLRQHGFTDNDFTWALENTAQPTVVGVNYYPQHSTEVMEAGVHLRGGPGELRPRKNDGVVGLKDLLTTFADRYGKPVYLTETGYTGTVAERINWMRESIGAVAELRSAGVDVVGYNWWCITDMVEWSYRHGNGKPMDYKLDMGLWALEEDADGVLRRVRTAAADEFTKLVAQHSK